MYQAEIEDILFNLLNNSYTTELIKNNQPVFEMIDASEYEYIYRRHGKVVSGLYKENQAFFERVGNWFSLANNNKEANNRGFAIIAANWGSFSCSRRKVVTPHYAACLLLKLDKQSVENFKKILSGYPEGFVDFRLAESRSPAAYLGLVNYFGEHRVGFVIPNKEREMSLPFSTWNNRVTTYNEACCEKGTLPWMVENNKFLELLPISIEKKRALGFFIKPTFKETAEMGEDTQFLLMQIEKLKEELENKNIQLTKKDKRIAELEELKP